MSEEQDKPHGPTLQEMQKHIAMVADHYGSGWVARAEELTRLRAEVDHLKAERDASRLRQWLATWVETTERPCECREELKELLAVDAENRGEAQGGIAPRVLALARDMALINHEAAWFKEASGHDGTYHDNSTCPHPDCYAVRSPNP